MNTTKLLEVIQDLSLARELKDVMRIVRKASRELTGSDGATFVLRDGESCYYAEEDAIGPLWKGQRFPLTACISGWVMLNKRTAVIPDIYKDPRIPADAYRPTFVKSLVMVPIRKANPLGAIGNYWSKEREPTPEEISIAEALANATAITLENLQLYSSLQNKIAKLDEENRYKDELLMIVSHELRTPLNAVEGWAQLLEPASNPSLDDIQDGVKTILRNIRAHGKTIKDILDTSEAVLGRIRLDRTPVDFEVLLRKSVDNLQILAHEKKVALRLAVKIKNKRLSGDPARLTQILDHLLGNALKFTPPGGKIDVSLGDSGPNLKLVIADSGAGLKPELKPHLFGIFRQGDSSASRKHAGLGLGLALVKQLVEAHGGSIEVESPGPNQGTTFTLLLPASPADLNLFFT